MYRFHYDYIVPMCEPKDLVCMFHHLAVEAEHGNPSSYSAMNDNKLLSYFDNITVGRIRRIYKDDIIFWNKMFRGKLKRTLIDDFDEWFPPV